MRIRPHHVPRIAGALLLAAAGSGCMSGLIYTHTVQPLTTNFERTPVFVHKLETGDSDVKHLTIPVANVPVTFEWSTNAFGDIARREGLAELYYADLEVLSVLGIWQQRTVHLYGKPAPDVR